LAVTNTLAASGQAENISIGTSILTSSTSGAEGTVTYSITESDNKFTIDSSTGEVTLANTLDYETATSHTFTVVATDGETTVTETFALNVSDVSEVLALTVNLENTEPFAEGTNAFVASPSLNNPNNETITYTLSGIGSDDFEVSEDGRVFATSHDFDSAKSYTLTLTATAGSASVSDTFTVNIANVVEQDSALLRYSAAYNSASRTGFSASATRGPSGSTLPAYYLEQVGATSSTNIRSADGSTGNGYYVDVTIDGGTQTNWRYNFPIQSGGVARFVYGKNYLSRYGYYQSLVGTQVTTLINQNSDSSYGTTDLVSAGMIMDGYFYFMTTDDAESSINYTSATQGRDYGVIVASDSSSYYADGGTWPNSITGAGYTLQECHSVNVETCLNNAGINLSDVGIMVNVGPGEVTFGYTYSELADWIDDGGNYAAVMWEAYSGAFRDPLESQAMSLISALGWQNYTTYTQLGKDMTGVADSDATITSSILNAITNNGGTLDYSSLINKTHYFWDNGLMDNIPSVCNSLVDGNLGSIHTTGSAAFICDPGRTGSSGAVLGVADRDAYRASENSFMTDWFAGLDSPNPTTSTYNLFEDQVVLAGQIFTDTMFTNYTNNAKTVTSWAVVPVENYLPSGSMNDYFFPNFIPGNFWSYGTVGVDYCAAMNIGTTCPNSYNEDYYIYSQNVMEKDTYSYRFSTNESPRVPYGQSLWWQVLNPNGVGVGLWAQISFKDSYDGALGSTTRDDQESLLSVVISNLDYRKNDTSRYSAGDTGLGMDGYHYWSYQGPTNDTSDGLGIIYGTSTIECATSNESGCFWADHNSSGANHAPAAAMITSSDPYKSGDMTLGVSYNSNNETFETGTFNTVIIRQNIPTQGTSLNATLSDFRSSYFYDSTASSYSGFFSGILEFDVSGSGNSQLASMRSSSTLASFSFDATNDDVQVVAPMTISAAPANNYTANWTTVDTGSMTLKFGDATNDEAKSAYLSSEVFAAEIQDDGAQVDGSSGGSNNLAGVMVSYNTIDREDRTLFHSTLNSIPDTAYSTWGFWAMSSVDISPDTGTQNASVHLGTWVAGETLAPNEIPTSGSASMSGAAVMNVAYRYNETGNNYNVHKYTTTANVAGTFNWGASGYSGSLDFTHYDDNNPIVENAGFHSFTVAIVGTDHTYTGNSTDTLDNGWLGGASVAGALYGGTSPDESGGRINVNLYKSGDIGTAGA
ncbi:MAG: cadherin domain-containing protein, partial [Schleiferiaceae bacterium]